MACNTNINIASGPTVIRIYEAIVQNYSGSIYMNIIADDGSTISINLGSQVLRFASGSGNHGFGFRASGNSLLLETPQPLTSGSNVIFNSVTAGNSVFKDNTNISGSLSVRNVLQKNQFILVNSASAASDGGFIVRSGSSYSGIGFGWDDSAKRFGIQVNNRLHFNSSSISPEAYVAQVVDVDGGQNDSAIFQKTGNIRISGSEAYIYV